MLHYSFLTMNFRLAPSVTFVSQGLFIQLKSLKGTREPLLITVNGHCVTLAELAVMKIRHQKLSLWTSKPLEWFCEAYSA